jgi:hypothetical protein
VTGSCEHGNEPSGSIKDGEFFYCLSVLSGSKEKLLHRGSLFGLRSNVHCFHIAFSCGQRIVRYSLWFIIPKRGSSPEMKMFVFQDVRAIEMLAFQPAYQNQGHAEVRPATPPFVCYRLERARVFDGQLLRSNVCLNLNSSQSRVDDL